MERIWQDVSCSVSVFERLLMGHCLGLAHDPERRKSLPPQHVADVEPFLFGPFKAWGPIRIIQTPSVDEWGFWFVRGTQVFDDNWPAFMQVMPAPNEHCYVSLRISPTMVRAEGPEFLLPSVARLGLEGLGIEPEVESTIEEAHQFADDIMTWIRDEISGSSQPIAHGKGLEVPLVRQQLAVTFLSPIGSHPSSADAPAAATGTMPAESAATAEQREHLTIERWSASVPWGQLAPYEKEMVKLLLQGYDGASIASTMHWKAATGVRTELSKLRHRFPGCIPTRAEVDAARSIITEIPLRP